MFFNSSGTHDDRSRLFFRPLSVQERIRELNLRARHFAETIMAVQLHGTIGSQNEYAALMHTRSLEVSLFCLSMFNFGIFNSFYHYVIKQSSLAF